MTPFRLMAVLFIYGGTTLAWFILDGTIADRTGESNGALAREVERLWGGRHRQVAPTVEIGRPRQIAEDVIERDEKGNGVVREVRKTVIDRVPIPLTSTRADVSLSLDQRRKGLLWYDTYGVSFKARYTVRNPDNEPRQLRVHFAFPSWKAIYDAFVFRVDGKDAPPVTDLSQDLTSETTLAPGAEAVIEIAYRSRGMDDWTYAFAKGGVAQVRDFELVMKTDFDRIDFPVGTISPHEKVRADDGWRLRWRFESLAAGQNIGMDAPNRLNPGPVAARITFFAPVSLLFFFTVIIILGALRGRCLHPMNYFFLAAAFFSFHLLLAYLVDHMELNIAFLLAAATSILLVVTYLRIVAGMRVALVEAGLAQLVFLVLFSYAFFYQGYTGLTVTIGSVITLFVLMQITARTEWAEVFSHVKPHITSSSVGILSSTAETSKQE